ncbi:MAG: hypothetical protein ACOC0P_03480, partial [Planctomycetota bacterium]
MAGLVLSRLPAIPRAFVRWVECFGLWGVRLLSRIADAWAGMPESPIMSGGTAVAAAGCVFRREGRKSTQSRLICHSP